MNIFNFIQYKDRINSTHHRIFKNVQKEHLSIYIQIHGLRGTERERKNERFSSYTTSPQYLVDRRDRLVCVSEDLLCTGITPTIKSIVSTEGTVFTLPVSLVSEGVFLLLERDFTMTGS